MLDRDSASIPRGRVPPHGGPVSETARADRATTGAIPPSRRAVRGGPRSKDRLIVAVELVALGLLWEFVQGSLKLVNPVFLPPPSEIWEALVRLATRGDLLGDVIASMTSFAYGFSVAAVGGIAIGLAIGGSKVLTKLVAPLVWALYAMPLIAIRPMTPFWFGFGTGPIIFLVFLAALLPMILNTMAGVRTVDRSLVQAARVFGASRAQIFANIVLPATVPFIMTGLRLAVIIAWIILLASEIVSAPRGFGHILAVATSRFRVDEAFAAIFLIVVISVSSVRLVGYFEQRVSSWRLTVR